MKRKLSKLVSILIAVVIGCSLATLPPITAEQEEIFGEGLIPETEEELEAFAKEFDQSDFSIPNNARFTLPSSVDLSTSPCFPPIGNQGGIGSCTAWASTYYQYSYEVNMLNNVNSAADRVIYSPKWTYNNINRGIDKGSTYIDAYKLLENQGALTQSQFPYPTSTSNYNIHELPTYANAVNDMRDALNTRLVSFSSVSIPESGVSMTRNNSELAKIKLILNGQKVLTFQTWNDFNYKYGTGNWSNTKLVYRCYDSNGSSHAMTVVGYDDNVTCDINGNGIIEEGEKGAFKVINSWGLTNTGANNSGVIWIMYDALNWTSTNNLDESLFQYKRRPAMGTGNKNVFNLIHVGHKDVALVAEVSFSTNRRNQVQIDLGRGMDTSKNDFKTQTLYGSFNGDKSLDVAYDGTMVFDFGDLADKIFDYYCGYYWRIYLKDASSDSNRTTIKGMKITDDKGNVINNLSGTFKVDGSQYAPMAKIDLEKGDMNYDRALSYDDYNVYGYHLFGSRKLSYLQRNLGDLNSDGAITTDDMSIFTPILRGTV